MRPAIFLLSLLVLTGPAPAQPQPRGIFFGWGAFEQAGPRKCYAIAQPELSGRARPWPAFASVGFWPERAAGPQFHARLSRKKRPGSAVILRVGDRSFQLLAGGGDAWAANPRADAAIAAAIRAGVSMSVETRSEQGGLVRDRYQLRGAASAIDAAAIACARR
jgi:hypothetical protein